MEKDERSPLLLPKHPETETKFHSARGGFLVSAIMSMYVFCAKTYVPLQGQYVHSRLLEQYNITINVTFDSPSCGNNSEDDPDVLKAVQTDASQRLLYFTLSNVIPSAFVNLVFGSYSDYLGRKMLFLLPLFGDMFNYLIFAMIARFELNLYLVYFGSVLSGMCGSFTTMCLACFAYTVDITRPRRSRTVALAIVEFLLSLVASGGYLLTGFLIYSLGYFWPAQLIVIILAMDIVIVFVVLPETLKTVHAFPMSPVEHMKKIVGFFAIYGSKKKRFRYTLCLLVMMFSLISLNGRTTIETLYQLGAPFCWTSMKIGYYGALRIFIQGTGCVLVIKLMQPRVRDELIAVIGMGMGAASLTLEAFAYTNWMMYLVPVVGFAAYTAMPIFRSIMSRMTSPAEQGALFSSIAVMETVCATLSASLYNTVYRDTLGITKGTVFLMMAGFFFITIVLSLLFMTISGENGASYNLDIPENSPNDCLHVNPSVQNSQGKEERA